MPESVRRKLPTVGEFRVGDWLVLPSQNRLSSGVATTQLEPQTMDVLVFLAGRAGDVVSKQGIIDAVWEGRLIAEGTLTNAVAELRRALGDDARRPRFIETIPKRGYRVIAEVTRAGTVEEERPRDGPGARRGAMRQLADTAAAAGRGVAEAVRGRGKRSTRRAAALDPRRVLVLPFENRTGDPERDVIGLMAMDWLSQGLARWAVGDVVPASTAREMVRPAGGRHGDDPVLAAAAETGAGVIVWGSYYLESDSLLIQANVTDTTEERLLWALDPVVGRADAAVEVIERLRQRVAGLVACHFASGTDDLGQVDLDLIGLPPPFDAYREFLDGRELIFRDMAAATRHFRRAVDLAPGFGPAWANLIVCHFNTGDCDAAAAAVDEMEASCPMGRPAQEHMRVFFRARLDGQWMPALAALQSLEAVVPHDGPVKIVVATAALRAGRPEVAVEACSAIQLSGRFVRHPASIVRCGLIASALHTLGEHRRELAEVRAVAAVNPNPIAVLQLEIRALAAAGRLKEVERVLDRSLSASAARPLTGRLMLEAAVELRAHGRRGASIGMAERAAAWVGRGAQDADPAAGRAVLRGALCVAERWLEAREEYEHAVTEDELEAWGTVGWLSARVGDEDRAAEIDTRLERVQRPYLYGEPMLQRARIEAHRGDRNRAMELLHAAFAAGLPHDVRLHRDLGLEPLWDEPRFWKVIGP